VCSHPEGLEVGFYSGCVSIWRKLQSRDPTFIPERTLRGLTNLEELLASLNFEDPQVGMPEKK
jgi:hypothetical protein